MKVRRGKFSGAIGNEVYVNAKHGQFVRSRPRRPPRPTNDRVRAQDNLGGVAKVWRTLSNEQFAAWAAAARKEGMLPYRFFCQINGTLAAYGQPRLLDPPKRERLRPNPVEALEIRNRRGVTTLRLRVPKAPAEFTFVFGVRWCSRGMSVPRSNGVLLGRLPQAVHGWSEITDLYATSSASPRPVRGSSSGRGKSSMAGKTPSSGPTPMCPRRRSKRNTLAARQRHASAPVVARMLQACS